MRLINADELIATFMNNALDFDSAIELIESVPTIDAIPIGCLELEKRDCSFANQCDMGGRYEIQMGRACQEIIKWWKTPRYQKCLEVAEQRGFVKQKWSED